jgi:PIN domain nuclease of toxin-antitoxin system
MELLLDTHALIWFINGDVKLPENSIKLIKNINNRCFVSIASLWEIAIKTTINKLEILGGFNNLSKLLKQNDFEIIPISFEHLQKLVQLDFHHRDPFDRIIIAQGIVENLTIVTKDEIFSNYIVNTVWDNK